MQSALLTLASYRLRIFFRGIFVLLTVAIIALALFFLEQEKQRSYKNYEYSFHKTGAQIASQLRHPTGQFALLNPQINSDQLTPLRPLLLPFSALDFDDQYKVQQAVEMAGCSIQYKSYGTLCVAVGNSAWGGGFIYVTGSFASGDLVPHQRGDRELHHAHRIQVSVAVRGYDYRWIAPFETQEPVAAKKIQGRLTGFVDNGSGVAIGRPVKDFRGWIWQDAQCLNHSDDRTAACSRRSFFSVRLPVDVLRDALFSGSKPAWPPADLDQILVHVAVLPPGDGNALLDSNSADATAPFALNDLRPLLSPGEALRIRKTGGNQDLITLVGRDEQPYSASRLIAGIIRRLPVAGYDTPLVMQETIATLQGDYQLMLSADVRSLNKSLAVIATRASWFVAAILLGIWLVWLVIEVSIVRRIAALTKRASTVSRSVKGTGSFDNFTLTDLRGTDELGILASCLADLLQRVKEDIEREHIRTEQEKDMWHAVGHEIMSPLQSLMALHSAAGDESTRYIKRMQQAIRVLYGSASPSEAFQSTTLTVQVIDLNSFLRNVADYAHCIGIDDVRFTGPEVPVMARANDHSLEDVVTHILRNAERYRQPGTLINIELSATETSAGISIANTGSAIPDAMIDKIFEYGVSDQQETGAHGSRGQGLFVAKTYMAKMGGTITAHNTDKGVTFVLSLQCVSLADGAAL